MENLTKEQITAIKCAYLDLKGALKARHDWDLNQHDWDAHEMSIDDLEEAFPFLKFS